MGITRKEIGVFVLFMFLGFFSVAHGAGKLSGTVTEKQGDKVKVDFKSNESLAPDRGDKVDFITLMEGIEVKAGQGQVVEVGSGFVWVKIIRKPVRLKMNGIIHATGEVAIEVRLDQKYEVLRQTKDPAVFNFILGHADQGNGHAHFLTAYALKFGLGVAKNKKESERRFRLAAEQGHMKAQYRIAMKYDYGWGVAEDDKEAVIWYRKAGEQGLASAQNRLGEMYFFEFGVKKDDAEALKWFKNASEQGDAEGEYNYGYMYQEGLGGLKKDLVEAVKWYEKAAVQGESEAQYALGVMYHSGIGVKTNRQKALEWFLKAAEQDQASAQYNLGIIYETGQGVAQNRKKAIAWYRKAAAQNHKKAKEQLRDMGGSE